MRLKSIELSLRSNTESSKSRPEPASIHSNLELVERAILVDLNPLPSNIKPL
ncbi:hypothetical protein AG1IA_09183 [Rhizoctonia solani AG-1 IA]|uniref:Uncharacterized protein n=1 Tax=Thanatephorus cucumeris (strain AG1-IA) TaxID=983506 RepID=L8WFS3_THACA|nr:hypothetical protein AG1IA_09183 [Rhizoctonia solani AG-1 IA]